MTSPSPKKLPITRPNLDANRFQGPLPSTERRFKVSAPVAGLLVALVLAGPLGAQTQVQTTTIDSQWTNRSTKVWAASVKSPSSKLSTELRVEPTNRLPWQPVQRLMKPAVEGQAPIREVATSDRLHAPTTAADTFPPARFPNDYQSDEPAEFVRLRARQIATMHLRSGESFGMNRPELFQAHDASLDPFGDKMTASTGPLSGRMDDDPFQDPFGDNVRESFGTSRSPRSTETPGGNTNIQPALFQISPQESAATVTEPSRQLFQLNSTESNVQQPEMRRRLERRRRILHDAGALDSLEVHAPMLAFQLPEDLRLDPFSDESQDRAPQLELDELPTPSLDSLPEFPTTEAYSQDVAPSPENVPGNRDLPRLPDIEEPERPDGSSDGELELPESFRKLPDLSGSTKPDEEKDDDSDEDQSTDDDEEEEKCDRIYNDRQCCDIDESCQNARDSLNRIKISDISVSISPSLTPLSDDETDLEEQRERLSESPSREWRNQNNTIVAIGKLEDLVDDRIVIRSQDGGIRRIPFTDLGRDELCFVTAWWGLPGECSFDSDDVAIRDFRRMTFTWSASAVCNKPLYFEESQLERYGHTAGPVLQPLLSSAHFFANVIFLPYNMGVYTPNECRYDLGYYRPGSCAPWLVPALPLSRRGLAFEAIGLTGFFGIF